MLDMEKKIKIRVLSIREEYFDICSDALPTQKDECNNIYTMFAINFEIDKERSLLKATLWTNLFLPSKEDIPIVSYSFSYTLHIDPIQTLFSKVEGNQIDIKLPTDMASVILTDMYAAARALLSVKLSGTILNDYYLPFDGAAQLIENIRATQ